LLVSDKVAARQVTLFSSQTAATVIALLASVVQRVTAPPLHSAVLVVATRLVVLARQLQVMAAAVAAARRLARPLLVAQVRQDSFSLTNTHNLFGVSI